MHWLENNADGLHFLGEKVSKKYGVQFHSKWAIITKKIGKQVPQLIEKVINYQEGIRNTVLITSNQYSVLDWTYTNQNDLKKKESSPFLLAAKNTGIRGIIFSPIIMKFLT